VSKVTATLQSLSHSFPTDVDVLLVGPGGQRVVLMSRTSDGTPVNNASLTFDDAATASLPAPGTAPLTSGTYRPTNFGGQDAFPAAAPGPPYGSALAGFNNTNPNGAWRLFVFDAGDEDTGRLVGWRLNITSTPSPGRCSNPFTLTSGNDTFEGGAGGDRISGLAGQDVVSGLDNRDCIRGGADRDRLSGNSGADDVRGNSGSDRVSGNSGRDRVYGNTGNDRVSGGSSGDRVYGGSGRDRVSGNSGNDRVYGNGGRDRMFGNAGRDTMRARDGRRDRVNCGSGRDRAFVDDVDLVASNCERVFRS
jgi:Ca2+-binding RTX toxin-like protein